MKNEKSYAQANIVGYENFTMGTKILKYTFIQIGGRGFSESLKHSYATQTSISSPHIKKRSVQ